MTFIPTAAILFFIAFSGIVLMHLANVRAAVAMAARDGARTYGVFHNADMAVGNAWLDLKSAGLVPQSETMPWCNSNNGQGEFVYHTQDPRIIDIRINDDGTWCTFEITYAFMNPNPFRNLPMLVLNNTPWKPNGFPIKVTASAKDEYNPAQGN